MDQNQWTCHDTSQRECCKLEKTVNIFKKIGLLLKMWPVCEGAMWTISHLTEKSGEQHEAFSTRREAGSLHAAIVPAK